MAKEIRYIGKRPEYRENTYGSGLLFIKGESQTVSDELGAMLLRHKDQYELVGGKQKPVVVEAKIDPVEVNAVLALQALQEPQEQEPASEESLPAPKKVDEGEENALQDARDAVALMDKDALSDYAKVNFAGHKVSKNMALDNMRAKVIGLIDQYGLA